MEPLKTDASRGGRIFVPTVCFVLISVTGGLLLVTALVVWLSTLIGSLIGSMLIVSGACLLTALMIYLIALRGPFRRIDEQINTIYEVARAARSGYEWMLGKFRLLTALLDLSATKRE